MTNFYLIAGLLVVIALSFVVLPLLHRPKVSPAERAASEENVGVYQARLAELQQQRAQGLLDETEFRSLKDELGLTLLSDLEDNPGRNVAPQLQAWRPAGRIALLASVAVVVAAVLLYRWLGAIDDVRLARAAEVLDAPQDQASDETRGDANYRDEVADLVQLLRQKLKQQPDDEQSWYLLGHALMRQQTYAASEAAFKRLLRLTGPDSTVELSLAQAMFLARKGKIDNETRSIMQRILKQLPNQPMVREMMAMSDFQQQDYLAAAQDLKSALDGGGLTSSQRARLQQSLRRAAELAGDSDQLQRVLSGSVSGKSLPPGDHSGSVVLNVDVERGAVTRIFPARAVLFVMARLPGQRMPIAVVRHTATDWPVHVILDKSSSMRPNGALVPGQEVEVVARVALSGSVNRTPDDVETTTRLRLTPGTTRVVMSLDGTAAAIDRSGGSLLTDGKASVATPALRLKIALADGLKAPPQTTVFVFARPVGGPPMPIVVKRMTVAELPKELTLTDADSMLASRKLSQFDAVELVARLSFSGQPALAAGDKEVISEPVDPKRTAAPISLTILR